VSAWISFQGNDDILTSVNSLLLQGPWSWPAKVEKCSFFYCKARHFACK